jgi:hypothetical protein
MSTQRLCQAFAACKLSSTHPLGVASWHLLGSHTAEAAVSSVVKTLGKQQLAELLKYSSEQPLHY